MALLAWAAAPTAAQDQEREEDAWSVLLITVDCLRPDHMSLYGYERDTTPYLTRFGEESVVFENAFATSTWTSPGIASILTGYYPPVHAQSGQYSFYDEEMPTALRLLRDSRAVLGTSVQGPTYSNYGFHRRIPREKDRLEALIEDRLQREKPFFAWVHLRDVHLPYAPSEANANRWIDTSSKSEGVEAVRNHKVVFRPRDVEVDFPHPGNVSFTEADIPVVRALYDGEVADVDQRLERVLEGMRETGMLDRTLVIISADHGEELFEHGWVGHASTSYDGKLHDVTTRIPLIMRFPKAARTGRFDALVQGLDIMPTVLEALGIDATAVSPAMQGRSLMPVIGGETREHRQAVFQQSTLKGWTTPREEMRTRVTAVRSKTQRLIRIPTADGYRMEGYDLREDPGEQSNIYADRKSEFAELETKLQAWDDENRAVAADLVIGAMQRQQAGLEQALRDGALGDALQRWLAIDNINKTWALEADPVFDHEPQATASRDVNRRAAAMVAKAMTCVAEGGSLAVPDGATSLDAWACSQ